MIVSQFHKSYSVPEQMLLDDNVSKIDIIVYMYLLELAGTEYNGDKSQRDMAKERNISIASFNKAIKKLENRNFIKMKRDHQNLPAIYEICSLPYEEDINREVKIKKEILGVSKTITPLQYNNTINIIKTKIDTKTKINTKIIKGKVMGKEIKDINTNDLCKIWTTRYFGKFGVVYGIVTGKERGQVKRMLEEYGPLVTFETIKYTIDKDTVIGGYPSISALYGFRRTLVAEAIVGLKKQTKKKAIHQRQYKGDNWSVDEGF